MTPDIIEALVSAAEKVYNDTRPEGSGTWPSLGAAQRPRNRDALGKALAVYEFAKAQDQATGDAVVADVAPEKDREAAVKQFNEAKQRDNLGELAGLAYSLAKDVRAAYGSVQVPPDVMTRVLRVDRLYDVVTG